MKKYLPFLAVIIVIVVIAAVALNNKNSNNNSTTPAPAPASSSNESSANNASNTNATPQSSQTNSPSSVSIANMTFSPGKIIIKKGTTVTWTNNDSIAHTVTAKTDKEHGPNSGTLNPGKNYSFTFNDDGTFDYFCEIHPSMTGTVTVTD
jgi:plastocyanin